MVLNAKCCEPPPRPQQLNMETTWGWGQSKLLFYEDSICAILRKKHAILQSIHAALCYEYCILAIVQR